MKDGISQRLEKMMMTNNDWFSNAVEWNQEGQRTVEQSRGERWLAPDRKLPSVEMNAESLGWYLGKARSIAHMLGVPLCCQIEWLTQESSAGMAGYLDAPESFTKPVIFLDAATLNCSTDRIVCLNALLGVVVHEASHILWSRDYTPRQGPENLFHNLWEDERIERLVVHARPGVCDLVHTTKREVLQKNLESFFRERLATSAEEHSESPLSAIQRFACAFIRVPNLIRDAGWIPLLPSGLALLQQLRSLFPDFEIESEDETRQRAIRMVDFLDECRRMYPSDCAGYVEARMSGVSLVSHIESEAIWQLKFDAIARAADLENAEHREIQDRLAMEATCFEDWSETILHEEPFVEYEWKALRLIAEQLRWLSENIDELLSDREKEAKAEEQLGRLRPTASAPISEELAQAAGMVAERAGKPEEATTTFDEEGRTDSTVFSCDVGELEVHSPDRTCQVEAIRRYHATSRRLSREIQKLRKAIELRSTATARSKHLASGKLSHRDLYRAAYDPRVFTQAVNKPAKANHVFSILVDDSGSMQQEVVHGATRAEYAFDASILLLEALRSNRGHTLEVMKHGSQFSLKRAKLWQKERRQEEETSEAGKPNEDALPLLHRLSQPQITSAEDGSIEQYACLLHQDIGGINYDALAIEYAVNRLLKEYPPDKQKVLIVLSDGLPNSTALSCGVEETRQAVDSARRAGINVIGLVIDESEAEAIYSKSWTVAIQDPRRIATQLGRLIRHFVR